MKKQIVCLGCLLVLFAENINAQGISGETGLGETVIQFFEALVLKRSPQKAVNFVSKNAIVGECILPERWSGKKLSRAQVTSIFREAFDVAGLPRVTKLEDVITSDGTDLMEGKVSLGKPFDSYFQVFKINESSKPQDVAYVCKFDDREWFRKRVASPDVRYVLTRLKSGGESSKILTTLWIPEKATWRILTFEVSSDED